MPYHNQIPKFLQAMTLVMSLPKIGLLSCHTSFYATRVSSSLIQNNAKKYWIVEIIIENTIAGTKDQDNDC